VSIPSGVTLGSSVFHNSPTTVTTRD
jgi:hypothetical protein